MAFRLDEQWLLGQADDAATRAALGEAITAREVALLRNEMPTDTQPLCLRLAGLEIWLESCSAFSAIEVYQELFKDNGHFLHSAFHARDARMIIDAGANLGFYALRLRQVNPTCRIICVEANPTVYPYLRKNLDVNGCGDVQSLHAAIGGQAGKMEFAFVRQITAIGGKGVGMVKRSWLKSEFIDRVQVDMLTLSGLCERFGVKEIDLLKIDIEGMELEAIREESHVLSMTRRAVIERHSDDLRTGVIGVMQANGFALVYEDGFAAEMYYSDLYFDRESEAHLSTNTP